MSRCTCSTSRLAIAWPAPVPCGARSASVLLTPYIRALTNRVNDLINIFMERSWQDIVGRARRRVAWLRHTKKRPASEQMRMVRACHPSVTYSTEDGETLANMLSSLRAGDVVIVAGLHRLGASVSELRDALAHIRSARAQVVDVSTGVLFDADSVLLLAEAERVINGERRGAGMTLAMKRREHNGGRKRADGSMLDGPAKKVWMSRSVATNAAASEITGWSVESMLKHFGPSGRPAGRPQKSKR